MRGKLTTGQTKHHSLFTEKRQATQIRPRTNLRKVIVAQNKQPASKQYIVSYCILPNHRAILWTNKTLSDLQVGQQREKNKNTEAGKTNTMQLQKENNYNANTENQIQCKYRKANKTHPTERPIQRDRAPPNIIPTVFATGGAESNKYERQSEQIRIKEFQLTSTNDQLRHFSDKTFCKVVDMDFNFINTNDFWQ